MTIHHRSDEFAWNPLTKTFVAEASDLGWPIGGPFRGAMDESLMLQSSATGKTETLTVDEVDRDLDYSGGWRAITFKPENRARRDLFKLVVFND